MLPPGDLVFASGYLRNSTLQLRIQLRYFKDRNRLTRANLVPDIHVDVSYKSGDLRMNVNYLVRLELTGDR